MFTYLRAYHFPIGAVASVAVFIPFESISGDVSINGTRFSHHCDKCTHSIRNVITQVVFAMLDVSLNQLVITSNLLDSVDQFCLVDTGSDIH